MECQKKHKVQLEKFQYLAKLKASSIKLDLSSVVKTCKPEKFSK